MICQEVEIAGRKIGLRYPTYIVAEMSANHMKKLDRAKKIILSAKESGADAVKLQSYKPDTITLNCHKPEFMATPGSIWEGRNLYDLYEEAYMPWEWHEELFDYAKKIGITIFSSPFDASAIDLLEELNTPAYKIASYEIADIPLIAKAAKTGKPIILATGIATYSDIELAVDTIRSCGNDKIIVLKCVSQYPTPYSELNLRTIPDIAEKFGCVSGLSDHSMGYPVDIASVTLGACMIEKHLTLSRADGGPDGSFSMEPKEFKEMVDCIRNVEMALGTVTYELSDYQKSGKKRSRSLYVASDMKAGDTITEENVKSVRPANGLPPKYLLEIIGKRVNRDLEYGTAMQWEYILNE